MQSSAFSTPPELPERGEHHRVETHLFPHKSMPPAGGFSYRCFGTIIPRRTEPACATTSRRRYRRFPRPGAEEIGKVRRSLNVGNSRGFSILEVIVLPSASPAAKFLGSPVHAVPVIPQFLCQQGKLKRRWRLPTRALEFFLAGHKNCGITGTGVDRASEEFCGR